MHDVHFGMNRGKENFIRRFFDSISVKIKNVYVGFALVEVYGLKDVFDKARGIGIEDVMQSNYAGVSFFAGTALLTAVFLGVKILESPKIEFNFLNSAKDGEFDTVLVPSGKFDEFFIGPFYYREKFRFSDEQAAKEAHGLITDFMEGNVSRIFVMQRLLKLLEINDEEVNVQKERIEKKLFAPVDEYLFRNSGKRGIKFHLPLYGSDKEHIKQYLVQKSGEYDKILGNVFRGIIRCRNEEEAMEAIKKFSAFLDGKQTNKKDLCDWTIKTFYNPSDIGSGFKVKFFIDLCVESLALLEANKRESSNGQYQMHRNGIFWCRIF